MRFLRRLNEAEPDDDEEQDAVPPEDDEAPPADDEAADEPPPEEEPPAEEPTAVDAAPPGNSIPPEPELPRRKLRPKPERNPDEGEPIKRVLKVSIARSSLVEPHEHDARIDDNGDGLCSWNEGHTHVVVAYEPRLMQGHLHKLIDPKTRKQVAIRATSYKPGSDSQSKFQNATLPIAPNAPEAAGAGAGPGGGGRSPAGPQTSSREWAGTPLMEWASESFAKFEVMRSIVQEGDSILDVGCGSGGLYEWLTKTVKKPVLYYGLERSEANLREFAERYPEVSQRLLLSDAFDPEKLPREHFTISASFGLTSEFGQDGEDKYAQLEQLVSFMRRTSDIMIVECRDSLLSPQVNAGMLTQTTWNAKRVRESFSGLDTFLFRPLTEGDFAIVAYREGVL